MSWMATGASLVSPFPLKKASDQRMQKLGQVLWSWSICDGCSKNLHCTTENCPFPRAIRLARYFEYYKALTASYEPDIRQGETPALRTHDDLLDVLEQLRLMPDMSRAQVTGLLFQKRAQQVTPPAADKERALDLAVKVMVMVNCSARCEPSGQLEHGPHQIPWASDVAFGQYITNIFPMTDDPSLNDEESKALIDIKPSLTARRLKKCIGLKFQPADNLGRHLKLDRRTNTLEIYHHTAFIKEHLRLTKDCPQTMSVAQSLRRGALPRQLALECLDSIQKVLFPLWDPKSRALLRTLVSKSSFDPDCLRFESASIRNDNEKEIAYHYFGADLADLFEELENPTPRGWLQPWLERKSGARYLMLATLIGVIFAVVLGMAALAVNSYQAWISYNNGNIPQPVIEHIGFEDRPHFRPQGPRESCAAVSSHVDIWRSCFRVQGGSGLVQEEAIT